MEDAEDGNAVSGGGERSETRALARERSKTRRGINLLFLLVSEEPTLTSRYLVQLEGSGAEYHDKRCGHLLLCERSELSCRRSSAIQFSEQ